MLRCPSIRVQIDLARIRRNAVAIKHACGVEILAVVKADAYGLGAKQVARAIADVVDGFYVFTLQEAIDADLRSTGKRTLAVEPTKDDVAAAVSAASACGRHESSKEEAAETAAATSRLVQLYREHNVQPAVWTIDDARRLRAANPVLSVDTGMQRFAAPIAECHAIIEAGNIKEAFAHGTRPEHSAALKHALGGRGLKLHSAATALMDDEASRLDAVRPGLALYRGATRVTSPLVEARDSVGPAGYGGFVCARFGVILGGYSNGLRPGVCAVGGTIRKVLEVGMQSAFIELGPDDGVGDEVELLGPTATEDAVAAAWGVSPQNAILHLAAAGEREWLTT